MEGSARTSLAIGAVILLASVAFAATRVGGLQGEAGDPTGTPAPEFTGIAAWLNSEPLTLEGLRGSVVLVDFWTYSCVNCVRTFPHLRALYGRYHPFGLEIVGVHAPEFDFERDRANVLDAIDRYGLPYPVAMDNEMGTWRAYRNNYWPHVYLIDADGLIRFDHIGEGGEDEIQRRIRGLLAEAGKTVPDAIDLERGGPSGATTPEIYAGYERGLGQELLASPEGYALDQPLTYAPPSDAALDRAREGYGAWFLEGPWVAREEFVEAAGEGARVILPFSARDVFFVASGPARVRTGLDGAPLEVVEVDRADLFTAVRLDRIEQHVLTLDASPGFRLYTFTFG